jgi:hypothetical protein
MAAVIFAAKAFTGPALLILDFDVQPLSGNLLADIGTKVREFAEQCRARAYVMMVPEPMLLHAQAAGLPAEVIPAHIKPEDLLLSAASFTASGEVKLCEPALAKTKTSPFGGALDFRAGADIDDPLRSAAILTIALGLDSTLDVTRAARVAELLNQGDVTSPKAIAHVRETAAWAAEQAIARFQAGSGAGNLSIKRRQ